MMRKGRSYLIPVWVMRCRPGRLNGPETLYQIGSIKRADGALMKLVEQGKVRLSDPIGHYLPGFVLARR